MFIGSTFLAITFMGGVYAVLPAYEADLFGEFFKTRASSHLNDGVCWKIVFVLGEEGSCCRFGAIAA